MRKTCDSRGRRVLVEIQLNASAKFIAADAYDVHAECQAIASKFVNDWAKGECSVAPSQIIGTVSGGLRAAFNWRRAWLPVPLLVAVSFGSVMMRSRGVEAAGTDIARSLQVDCAVVQLPEFEIGTIAKREIRGFVSTDDDLKRVQAFAKSKEYGVAVDVVPWPACEAMVALGPAFSTEHRPRVRTATARTKFKVGEPIVFQITAPDYFSFLYAVYLQTDGTVVNLLPRGGPLRQQTPPGHTIAIGSGQGRLPAFFAAPPTGAEAVIVIAARVPLRELEALDREGNRPYRLAFKNESKSKTQNHAFLDVLKTGLGAGLGPDKHSDVSAAVFHLKIED